MNVQAEMSLYPLKTNETSEAIKSFLDKMEESGLTVRTGNMSSQAVGDMDRVFAAIGQAFKSIANQSQVVLVLKISNACPLSDASEGGNPGNGKPA